MDDIGHDEAVGLAISANEEAVKMAASDQFYRAQVWSGVALGWAQIAAQLDVVTDPPVTDLSEAVQRYSTGETYSDQTLTEVRNALSRAGLKEPRITDAIREMQNAGILFRERV